MASKRPSWIEKLIPPHILSIPPYVPGKPVSEVARELGITEAIKMASNENPLGPSPLAVKALENHLLESHVYPESSAPELRAAVASRFGLSPDSIILGNGSDEIMEMVAHVFLQAGDEAVMAANAFSMYRICVEALEAKLYGFLCETIGLISERWPGESQNGPGLFSWRSPIAPRAPSCLVVSLNRS